MRSFVALMACLGLLAAVQALDTSTFKGVLLTADSVAEDMDSGVSEVEGHHHHHRHHHGPPPPYKYRHSWGPDHDPEDRPYWEQRHSAKGDFLACVHDAVRLFNKADPTTWVPAAQAFAPCVVHFLDHCHDAPGLSEEFTKSVPYAMFITGVGTLAASGEGSLLHIKTIMQWYLLGAAPTLPDGTTPNIWFTGGEQPRCASRLLAYLQSGCDNAQSVEDIYTLAKVVVEILKDTVKSNGANLGGCAPDIPAVILALTSTYCPVGGKYWNPFIGAAVPGTCAPEALQGPQYESSAGALLGGSVVSLLALSGNAKLLKLAIDITFAANRMALAATQTTSFQECIGWNAGAPTYAGQLATFLDADNGGIPTWSGPFLIPDGPDGYQARTPLPLGPDGQRILCAAIAMVSGDPNAKRLAGNRKVPQPTNPWLNNLLWQGQANIVRSILGTVNLADQQGSGLTPLTAQQKAGMCALARTAYTFAEGDITQASVTSGTPKAYVTVFEDAAEKFPYEVYFDCMTTSAGCQQGNQTQIKTTLPFGFTVSPQLALNHDLSEDEIPAYCSPA